MRYSIGIDMHQRYSFCSVKDTVTGSRMRTRVSHTGDAVPAFLAAYRGVAAAAVEATRNWYWMVNALDAADIEAHLVDPTAAKPLISRRNKTDRIDSDGISDLLAEGLLPESWMAPRPVRDGRELLRGRMTLVALRTATKNRLHGLVERYLPTPVIADLFGVRGRQWLAHVTLPPHAQFVLERQLALLDQLEPLLLAYEARIHEVVRRTPEAQRLDTLPGIGPLLALTIAYEVGTWTRFPSHEHFCSYSGLAPTIQASGGHTRYGPTPKASNRFLRWAFVEAANVIASHPSPKPVYQVFAGVRQRRGYGKAIVALARHLAVAAFHMLRKGEAYREDRVGSHAGQVLVRNR